MKTNSAVERTFQSRLGNTVKSERLAQLVDLCTAFSEGESMVRRGNELSSNALFLAYITSISSLRPVYGDITENDLEQVLFITQKLTSIDQTVAFAFLRTAQTIVTAVPDYAKRAVFGNAQDITNPLALLGFLENCASVYKDAQGQDVFGKWLSDGLVLPERAQLDHFGYDSTSRAVVDYFKKGGAVANLSTLARQFGAYAQGVIGVLLDLEKEVGQKDCSESEFKEFVEYLQGSDGKVALLQFYDGYLKMLLREAVPVGIVLRAGFARKKTKDLLDFCEISNEQLVAWRGESRPISTFAENSLQEEYDILTAYLTRFKTKEQEVHELEKMAQEISKRYSLHVDTINGKRMRLAQLRRELEMPDKKIDYRTALKYVHVHVRNLISEQLGKELDAFKDNARDQEYMYDVITRIDSELEASKKIVSQKKQEHDAEQLEKLCFLQRDLAFYNTVVEQQLRLLPKRNCPKLLEKEKQTWLFLPEGITVNGDYEVKTIGECAYVTRKEWKN